MAFLSRLRIKPLHRHFSSLPTPTSTKQTTRTLLSLLKSEKNPQNILTISNTAHLSPKFHLDRIAFSLLIQNLVESQSFNTIHTFIEQTKQRLDLRDEKSQAHFIVLYGQAGMIDDAITTFKEMEKFGFSPKTPSLNALLVACLIAKKYSEVHRIFYEFCKLYEIKPNLDSFNIVIKACCQSGDSSRSYLILEEMVRNRCKPDAVTFGRMLAGFYAEEKYRDVERVLELMNKYGQKQTVTILNVRVQSLCKLMKSYEAKALFQGVRKVKPNAVTYHHLIHGFGNEGNVEEVRRLYNDMEDSGIEPDAACYFTLVLYLCLGGDFETALRACRDSIKNKWYPNFTTLKKLVEGLVSISKVEDARELIKEVKERFTANADLWEEVEKSLPIK
ncbi:hypothetical protein ACHQM5_003613 [Ranunculus cassubicifolius]